MGTTPFGPSAKNPPWISMPAVITLQRLKRKPSRPAILAPCRQNISSQRSHGGQPLYMVAPAELLAHGAAAIFGIDRVSGCCAPSPKARQPV
jgi:hypothetical protein